MKTVVWLVAVIVSGAGGFYFGIGYGARTLSTIAAQNQVADGVSRIRLSLDALAQSDLDRVAHAHEQNLKSALFQIGTYSKSVVYWQCSDKDRETMESARKYAQTHPEVLSGPMQSFQSQGLELCTPPKGGA
jgi:hypothetical protein